MTTEKTETTEVKVLEEFEDSSFGLRFTPASIEMTRYEEMKSVIESIVEKYDKQVITREHKKSAEKSRSELIALEKSIDEERKAVKKVYNEPLDVYEMKMKTLQDVIKRPLDKIRDGLKEVEQGERDEREGVLIRHLKGKLEGLDIEIEQPVNWLNKGNFTQKGVGAKLEKEIDEAIDAAVKEKEQREVNEQIIVSFCETVDVAPQAWVKLLEFSKPTEIMQQIQDIKKAEKERLERAEQEAKELAELEEKNAQALAVDEHEDDAVYHVEPNPNDWLRDEEESAPPVEVEKITNVIEVTGTLEQLDALNKFMVSNGIKVRGYDPYAEDDLPF